MRPAAAALACSVLLALTLIATSHAADVTESSQPAAPEARAETVEPTVPVSFDPTAGASSTSEAESCNDTRSTVFQNTNPQVCMDHCASNGWTFVDSIDRRYYQICICCAD